ncbi:MAG: M20/M25/M40 family metallo-hydrolase [Acholeplasmataceae bacterium]
MEPWLIVLIVILSLLLILVMIRTLRFQSSVIPEMKKRHAIDEERIYESLSQMIQFDTVSYRDTALIKKKPFDDFRSYLKSRYPNIYQVADYSLHDGAILLKIKGENHLEPVVLMAHFDVVPVDGTWTHPPFSGHIDETHIHGRGTLDTKNSLCAIMESVEFLVSHKKTFKRDLYLAFGCDEETHGQTALKIVNHLKEKGIKPYFVLDEGGAVVSKAFPGVKEKAAVIGIAEKGFLNVRLVGRSQGGHASTPPKDQVMTNLAKVVTILHRKDPFRLKLTPAAHELFNHIAPYSRSFVIRMFFANLWLFLPLVKVIAKKSGGSFLASFKTTQAFTTAQGAQATNILPPMAYIGINYRLRPSEHSTDVIKRISKIASKYDCDVELVDASEATKTSLVDDTFKVLQKAILETFTDAIPTPYLMVATTDSRHYHDISEHVYKFSPMDVSNADLALIHSIDERITKANMLDAVYFYINLLEQF